MAFQKFTVIKCNDSKSYYFEKKVFISGFICCCWFACFYCLYFHIADLTQESRLPEFLLRPGDPLFLRCRAFHNTSQFGMKWYFENEKLTKVIIRQVRFLVSNS